MSNQNKATTSYKQLLVRMLEDDVAHHLYFVLHAISSDHVSQGKAPPDDEIVARHFLELADHIRQMMAQGEVETPESAATDDAPRCAACLGESGEAAIYFVEYQALQLNDLTYFEETGNLVYGWWGKCCAACLQRLAAMPELLWLEAVDLSSAVIVTDLGGGWKSHGPDWSQAVVRIGSREPTDAVQALVKACDPHDPQITKHEALERLAVLRMLAA